MDFMENLKKMAETNPQLDQFYRALIHDQEVRKTHDAPEFENSDSNPSISDLGQHWTSLIDDDSEEAIAYDKKLIDDFLATMNKKKTSGKK